MGAAGLAAAALHGAAGPHVGPAPGSRLHPVADAVPIISPAPPAPAAGVRPSPSPAMSADEIDRALDDAAPGTRDAILERLLETWADRDAPAAARFAELQDDPFLREVGVRTVAQRWTRADAEAAARWAAAIGDTGARRQAIDAVALVQADTEPRAALDLLARFGDGGNPGETLTGVIANWANRDFAAAQSWVEAQPPGRSRDRIVQRLAFMRAQADPPQAIQLASELLSDDDARREAYASIIRPWIERDAESARSWIASADAPTRRRLDAELVQDYPKVSANQPQ